MSIRVEQDRPVSREELEHECAYLEVRLRQAMHLQGAKAGVLVVVAGILLLALDHYYRDWNLSWPTLLGFVVVAGILLALAHRIPLREARHMDARVRAVRAKLSALETESEPKRQLPASD